MSTVRNATLRKRRNAAPAVSRRRRKPTSPSSPTQSLRWFDEPREDLGEQDEAVERWLREREAEDIERDDH